jgi:hypothetical protein
MADTEVVETETQVTEPESASAATTEVKVVTTETPAQSVETATGSESTEVTETATETTASEQRPAKPQQQHGQRATATIRAVKAENKALRAQLQALMAPQQTGQPQPPKPEETEEYWTQKYQSAQTDADRQEANRRYTEIHENKLVERAERQILTRFQRQQQSVVLSDKLTKLHERQPFLQQDGKIDITSPLVIRAAELAQESGDSLVLPGGAINFTALLLYGTEAALDMQGQEVQTTSAKLATQKAATAKAIARTQLETSSTQAAPKPSGKLADLDKELNALEERRRKGGPTFHDPDLNRQILVLRQRRAQAVASART